MTEPKRRGRPPGTKNKPKVTISEDEWANAIDLPRPTAPEPALLHILIRFKLKLGEPPEDIHAEWPKDWPLPSQSDFVRYGDLVGIVMSLEFIPEDGYIIINAR